MTHPLFSTTVRTALILLLTILILQSCEKRGPRVLVFTKTKGWKHTSIPSGIAAIQKLGGENGFVVDTTQDASLFTDENLKKYYAVIFLSTTGNVLNTKQQAAFERYIQAGGGFVGIHSAASTEYEWPWYNKLMGAHFNNHPHNPGVRKATVLITDKSHPSTSGLPDTWEREDEWYNYRSFYPGIKVVAQLDENTYDGGMHGSNHPIAWYHEFDGGRSFYTGLGHTNENYSEPFFLQHLLGGIKYAMGTGELDYSKAYAVEVPEENRFRKTVLVNDLDTPMELAIDDDGRVFFTELRSGNLYLYDSHIEKISVVHKFKLCTHGGTGLIGVTLDPDFSSNNFLYVYYSPPTEKEPIIFNLSRFTLTDNNTLDLSSEKILLQVPVQQNSGAHHGGSMAWDKDGNLYLSTGDSSSPFPANGYAPLDERPGEEFYSLDAQRSAGNTNDFKGKVLRIHPEKDGTYTIPEGNLFPKGQEKTKPEIYTMGCRNPYRIAVNPKTSVLYWGDIGPDAGKDSIQGPRGYDEFNQAKKAGNFGWPYFIGNNAAYAEWDFVSSTAGSLYDANAPVNNSPNNTGLTALPPATPPMIWYPYAASTEFPELGKGGRSAMAGEFYTFDKKSSSSTKFPEYYDGTLFVFDWMRNWVLSVRFDEDENYLRTEPFMASTGDFRRPIDLAFSNDGVMFMLEYGSVYGADNTDARLVKIEYNEGNRAPLASAGVSDSAAYATLDKTVFLTSELRTLVPRKEISGGLPLRVRFTSQGTRDLDDDDEYTYTYQWLFDGKNVGSTEPNPTYTYTTAGEYQAVLKVTDTSGATGTDTVKVIAGNEPPMLSLATKNNKSFYWNKKPFVFITQVFDNEDTKVSTHDVAVDFEYTLSGSGLPRGASLIADSDCKACHTLDQVSVGPSYEAIARRYAKQPDAIDRLATKIIAGGGGNWGKEHVMSAHPQLSTDEAKEIVKYILTLSVKRKPKTSLATQGTIVFDQHQQDENPGVYTIHASYTDKGNGAISPLTSEETITLRSATVPTLSTDLQVGFQRFGNYQTAGGHKAYFLLKNIDLTGIKQFIYEYASEKGGGEIEVRMNSFAGPVIASTPFESTGDFNFMKPLTGRLKEAITGRHDVYFIMIKRDKPNEEIIRLNSITFEN